MNEVINLDSNFKTFEENKLLKEKVQKLEYELATQKNVTKHFEGMAHIMMAELKKVQWVEAMSKCERLSSLFDEFKNEMRGFQDEKHQLLLRFSRIENIYHSIVAILKSL